MHVAPNSLQSASGKANRHACRSLVAAMREQSELALVDEVLGWPEATAPASGDEQPTNDSNADVAIHRAAVPSVKAALSVFFLVAIIGIL